MGEFSQGVETGYKTGLDPFSVLFQRLDKAEARKREDQKDLQELNKFFLGLKTQADNAKALQSQKDTADLQAQREKELMTNYEPAGPTDQSVNFQGTPFEAVAGSGKYKLRQDSSELLRQENLKYIKNINGQMGAGAEVKGNLIYRRADTGEEVPADVAQQAIAKGDNSYIISQKNVSKSGIKEIPVITTAEKKFKAEEDQAKKDREEKNNIVLDSARDTLATIAEVEKGIDNFGFTGNFYSIPGSKRKNWEVNVNKLLSGKIIDVMAKMKEASKTGATGFGQLSNKELEVLRDSSTALKKDLNKKDAQKYLNQMKSGIQKILSNEKKSQSIQSNDPEYQKYLQAVGAQ